jgi:hypothetical protein
MDTIYHAGFQGVQPYDIIRTVKKNKIGLVLFACNEITGDYESFFSTSFSAGLEIAGCATIYRNTSALPIAYEDLGSHCACKNEEFSSYDLASSANYSAGSNTLILCFSRISEKCIRRKLSSAVSSLIHGQSEEIQILPFPKNDR